MDNLILQFSRQNINSIKVRDEKNEIKLFTCFLLQWIGKVLT